MAGPWCGQPHHPRVRQGRTREGGREQPRQSGQHRAPGRQQDEGEARRRQHHQRPVVGEPRAPRDGGAPQRPLPTRIPRGQQYQRVGGEEEQCVEGVDLGDDGLRPELLRHPEEPRRSQGRHGRRPQQAGAAVQGAAGEGAEHPARQVSEDGGVAERQPREQMDDQRVERVTRGWGDAEVHAGHQEQAVVLEHHGARQGNGVERKRTQDRRGQRRGIGPDRAERRRSRSRPSPRRIRAKGRAGCTRRCVGAAPRLPPPAPGRHRWPAAALATTTSVSARTPMLSVLTTARAGVAGERRGKKPPDSGRNHARRNPTSGSPRYPAGRETPSPPGASGRGGGQRESYERRRRPSATAAGSAGIRRWPGRPPAGAAR